MEPEPSVQELSQLEAIWRDQSRAAAPPLDLTRPRLAQASRPASSPEVTQALGELLGWPQWVVLYPKPALAVVAASRLARARGLSGGVLWVAPGTGRPLDPPADAPGLAMLRCDWTPGPAPVAAAQKQARDRGLLLVVDESRTGLRLATGGAAQFYGLSPDLALYGPSLAGGRDFAALAGVGQAPPAPPQAPSAEALAAAAGTLAAAREGDWPNSLEAWGRALSLGLRYFGARTGVGDQVACEGPQALPRLGGRRLWAFLELCREEGLTVEPLVLFDPGLDPAEAPARLWPRLCRACARLKVLPEGEKAPHGWSEAHGPGKCIRIEEILQNLEP